MGARPVCMIQSIQDRAEGGKLRRFPETSMPRIRRVVFGNSLLGRVFRWEWLQPIHNTHNLSVEMLAPKKQCSNWYIDTTQIQYWSQNITGWWFQPIWKICSSNWIISPGRGEHKKYLKPPARSVSQILSTSNPIFHQNPGPPPFRRRIKKRALRFALRHPNHQSHGAKGHSNSHTSLREWRRKNRITYIYLEPKWGPLFWLERTFFWRQNKGQMGSRYFLGKCVMILKNKTFGKTLRYI